MNLETTIKLNSGTVIPQLGLGVYKSQNGPEVVNAVTWALEAGYRHVDTARIYRNEESVGQAIRENPIPREEIFVTTKLWNADQGYDATLRACEASLKDLDLDYVDLFLMHWPVEGKRLASWSAMERLMEEGRVKSIGVSNFLTRHLEELLTAADIAPSINQIEMSPYIYLHRKDTIDFCRENGILIEAYSPLTRGRKLDDPRLVVIAAKYDKTPAQVLIRWSLQHGFVTIPKSVNQGRIVENAAVYDFEITEMDMETLNGLDEQFTTGWDPSDAP